MSKRPTLKVFMGSSSEGFNEVAKTLAELLEGSAEVQLEVQRWTNSFLVADTNIGALESAIERADFAVLVLTADDTVVSRKKQTRAPRDNVLFELGLFMGRLGRQHCYFVHEKNAPPKLPSDLIGVIPAEYELPAGIDPKTSEGREALRAALDLARAQIVTKIADVVAARGARRTKVPRVEQEALEDSLAFAREIEGSWWSLRDWDRNSVGRAEIWLPEGSFSPRVSGDVYERSGRRAGHWESVASCLLPQQGKLYYYFTGHHLDVRGRPLEQYQGFTEYSFDLRKRPPCDGRGVFSDRNLARTLGREPKSLRLRRCTTEQVETLGTEDDELIAALLSEVLPRAHSPGQSGAKKAARRQTPG